MFPTGPYIKCILHDLITFESKVQVVVSLGIGDYCSPRELVRFDP